MKVLMLTTSFPLYRGHPAGVFVFEQARHLCRAGIDVHILAPWQPGGCFFETMAGVKVSRFPYFWPKQKAGLCYGEGGVPENMKKNPGLRIQLPFLVVMFLLHTFRIARRFDVVYAHWTLAGLAGVTVGKIMKKPVVVMMHHGQERYSDNPLEKFVINHADRVVCNSGYTRQRVCHYYRPQCSDLIPPGVDTDIFKPQSVDSSDVFFTRLGIPDHLPAVLTMGRHIAWKGFAFLLQAASQIRDRAPFVLIVGGQGPETTTLKKMAERLKIKDRVVFTGPVPNNDMPRLYNRADVFVLPSIVDKAGNTEGLGVVLMEAMACGTPCVASKVGGIPDVVQDGYNGFLTLPGDVTALGESILALLNKAELRESMGENGRRFIVENYSWTLITNRTARLLETVHRGHAG